MIMRNVDLHKLLSKVGIKFPSGFVNSEINNISFDSKNVYKGSLFLGRSGVNVDGGIFWKDAIDNGAEAAIISKEAADYFGKVNSQKVLVLNQPLDYTFGQVISEFYGRPSRQLKLIGVTGTNGKTTVTFLLEFLLKKLGKKVALLGTLFNRWEGFYEISSHTTDFADNLQSKLYSAKQANVEFVIMEVSSHSIAQKRISGCEFTSAVFTNLSQDHLDYHADMKAYFQTKMELFKYPYFTSDSFSVINVDNNWGHKLLNNLTTKSLIISFKNKKYSFSDNNEFFFISEKKITKSGSHCYLHTPNEKIKLFVPLVGEFNLMNAIQAITLLYNLGFPLKEISDYLSEFTGVPGRMEKIHIEEKKLKNKLPNVIVDYAHTPEGLRNVLETIKNFAKGKIITVFGCGGDRDSQKRSIMGEIAENFSDYIFITSDNPRTEDPTKIINEILSGIKNKDKVQIDIDRYKAIQKAINFANGEDIVLIAGKGHESYQILKNKTLEFDDRKVAFDLLKNY